MQQRGIKLMKEQERPPGGVDLTGIIQEIEISP